MGSIWCGWIIENCSEPTVKFHASVFKFPTASQNVSCPCIHLAGAAVDHLDAIGGAGLVEFVVDPGQDEDFAGHAKYRSSMPR
jgi:hypothetical protein